MLTVTFFCHYKTFHGHKCLMLSRPDPLLLIERVWLRRTNNLPYYIHNRERLGEVEESLLFLIIEGSNRGLVPLYIYI